MSAEAFFGVSALQEAVADARLNNGDPRRVEEYSAALASGSRYLEYARVAPGGAITIGFNTAAPRPIQGQTVIFEPQVSQGRMLWDCTGGTLAVKYRPAQCRR